MARETGDITLENLLSLALGTPEIGAVNFNYLFDVILQILKHLGISEKILNRESPIQKAAKLSSNKILSNPSPKDQSVDFAAVPSDAPYVVLDKVTSEEEKEGSTLSLSSMLVVSPNAGTENPNINELPVNNVQRSPSQIQLTENEKNITDFNRLETKPTSNMTQILFINKRLEASESAIEEITNIVDNIRSDIEDLKNAPISRNSLLKISTSNNKISLTEETKDTLFEFVRHLNEKVVDLELKFSMLQTKDKIQSLHTLDLDSLKTVSINKENSELISQNDEEKIKEKTENSLTLDKINQSEEKQHVDVKSLKISNTLISSPELSNKGELSEENLSLIKAMINRLETSLTTKLDKQLFVDLEAGHKEISEAYQMFLEKFKDFQQQLNLLEKNYSSINGELGVLLLKQEESEAINNNLNNLVQKLEHSFEDIEENMKKNRAEPFKMQSKPNSIDEGFVTKIRGSIFDMQDQQSKLQHQIDTITNKLNDTNTKIYDDQMQIESLKENKIDKSGIEILLEKKADIQLLESKIDRNQFNAFAHEMERNFQSVVQKVDEAETTTNKTNLELRDSIDTKMNKEELSELRSYIDSRFSSFKPKIIQVKDAQDGAAGSRKQLIKNCNCISCDRPVAVQHVHPGATLPYYEPLPVTKSLHPVTPFELQTIRQQAQHTGVHGNNVRIEISKERSRLQKELLQLCGVKDLEELSFQTNRACGGAHTLIEQHKRNPSKNQTYFKDEGDHFQKEDKVIDVLGRDGHIYKGNLQTPLPAIPRSPFKLETDTVELTDENNESVLSQLSNHWKVNLNATA
ncbi:uncharacterized protein LOC100205411 [Hydra vulgaris]|uniref:Uncharacterized protein LOC100205411 n=1 Tax=Hydra vulgaris TaxID=6087 RepID=A0ABM4CT63_HYDVU